MEIQNLSLRSSLRVGLGWPLLERPHGALEIYSKGVGRELAFTETSVCQGSQDVTLSLWTGLGTSPVLGEHTQIIFVNTSTVLWKAYVNMVSLQHSDT